MKHPSPIPNRHPVAASEFARAVLLHQQGKLDQAETLYRAMIAREPRHFDALHLLGVVCYQRGDNAGAMLRILAALELQPGNAMALSSLGLLHATAGRAEAALACYQKALAIKPDDPVTLNNCGNALRDLRRAEAALASYDKALALNAGLAEVHNNRGNALRDLARPTEALASFDRALALNPNYAEAHNNRGNALRDLKQPAAAVLSYDAAIALKPDFAEPVSNRGIVLADLRRPEEALADCDKALALKPNYAVAYDNKGVILTELGRFGEANQAFEMAIKLDPKRARSYYSLVESRRMEAGSPHLLAMEQLARDIALLASDEQIDLCFALGKAYADVGDHARSFPYLLAGNAQKRRQTQYNEAATLRLFERTQAAFSGELIRARGGQGDPSAKPVFIFGMPRSGTTLVEQILASHPQVFGCGEIDDFSKAVLGLGGPAQSALHIPEVVSLLSRDDWRELGAGYVERIEIAAPDASRMINKTPDNFRFAGLIHLALPNARFIHTRRDPTDTCLSCFSKRFVEAQPFSYDLSELGRYYRAYDRLMAHWRAVLPADVMLEVDYEHVVADLEAEARRIVAHCGLEWDPRCLDFHATERQVRTASMAQVRQPIYTTSVGRWRAYEPFLGPLLAELQPMAPDRS